MRLDKYLSDMGVGTRSELKKDIRKGGVSVDGEVITAIPNRAEYYQGQTPQSFNALRLKELFKELAEEEKSILTDACKILVLKGEPVALVRGDVSNMKITYTNDMRIARAMMEDEGR